MVEPLELGRFISTCRKEKKLRYSNPWIEGMVSMIYFLCYMLWFFLRKDEWRTLPMAEQRWLWVMIVAKVKNYWKSDSDMRMEII